MLLLFACFVTIVVVILILYNYNKTDDLDELRENLANRKAKWLKTPFDIGLKKPIGKWIYHPSMKIGIFVSMLCVLTLFLFIYI